ncbi:thioredoxin-like protein [Bisporella sp. PMI_857]|nr:thioredoxin-like protein [Bisporella sp. PMI_857]
MPRLKGNCANAYLFMQGVLDSSSTFISCCSLQLQLNREAPCHIHRIGRIIEAKMSAKYAFSQTLKEVRFLFCQTGESSVATRSFLTRAYPTMKKNNPQTPILLREAAGTLPRVFARYEFGQEKSADLSGLSDKQIEETVTGLVKGGV